jgi:hypothetical protein
MMSSSSTFFLENLKHDASLTARSHSSATASGLPGCFLQYDLWKNFLSVETGVGLSSHFSGSVRFTLYASSSFGHSSSYAV